MRSTRVGWLLIALAAVAVVASPGAPQPAASSSARPSGAAAPNLTRPASTGGYRATTLPPLSAFSVLQMNLCNSGFARCYAGGQSVPEATAVIAVRRPDVVTLNEICQGDSEGALAQAMERAWPADRVFTAFQPAWDKRRNSPYLCANGQQYGIAVMGHVAAADWAGVDIRGGIYPTQNPGTDEHRAWVCAYAIGNYYACTTHLESDNGGVAMAQCQYLMDTAIPSVRAELGGYLPTVIGGDFNMSYGGSPGVQDCVPSGWFRKGDGAVQQVLAAGGFTFESAQKLEMYHTDHPAWLVAIRTPAAAPAGPGEARPGGGQGSQLGRTRPAS
ncbi:MAG: hypothetical protein V7637_2059 [Mycobacteriales bacterium]|jgi:endonuclease/exonuclease/phosphatase family metal-dependent hydrolase